MAIDHDTWHVDRGGDDLTCRSADRTFEVAIIVAWILARQPYSQDVHNNVLHMYLKN